MDGLEKNTVELPSKILDNFSLRINQSILEMPSAFSNMCTRLTAIITQEKIIQERTLLDFNRFIIFAIKNNITQLPNSFCELSTHIADYWHYELDRETNSDRKYSYIRLYQMIDTVNAFYAEQNIQNKALKALDKQRKNANTIRLIQKHPGITYKKLLAMLSILPEDLQNQLQELELDGFLYGRHSGNERYYMLTNAGDVLYQTLITSSKNTLYGYWDNNRTKILVFLLEFSENRSIKKSSVLKLVQMLAEWDDQQADTFWNQVLGKYVRDTMWNTLCITENQSFSFIKELAQPRSVSISSMYKPTSPLRFKARDTKMTLPLHSEEPRKKLDIYNYI